MQQLRAELDHHHQANETIVVLDSDDEEGGSQKLDVVEPKSQFQAERDTLLTEISELAAVIYITSI